MPAAVDHPATREQVRLLYIANGGNLTLAAKTVGVPVDRAEKWKERAKVSWDSPNDPAAKQIAVSESVGHTANALAKAIADDSEATRAAIMRTTRKGAEHFAGKEPDEIIEKSKSLQHLASAGNMAGKWTEREDGGGRVLINIGILAE